MEISNGMNDDLRDIIEEAGLKNDPFEKLSIEQQAYLSYDESEVFGLITNQKFGGFSLSHEGIKHYKKALNIRQDEEFYDCDLERDDETLVLVVIGLGEDANGLCAALQVDWFDIKYKNYWKIDDYDGYENVIINYDKYELDKLKQQNGHNNDTIIVNNNDTLIVNNIRQLTDVNINDMSRNEMKHLLQKLKLMVS